MPCTTPRCSHDAEGGYCCDRCRYSYDVRRMAGVDLYHPDDERRHTAKCHARFEERERGLTALNESKLLPDLALVESTANAMLGLPTEAIADSLICLLRTVALVRAVRHYGVFGDNAARTRVYEAEVAGLAVRLGDLSIVYEEGGKSAAAEEP